MANSLHLVFDGWVLDDDDDDDGSRRLYVVQRKQKQGTVTPVVLKTRPSRMLTVWKFPQVGVWR